LDLGFLRTLHETIQSCNPQAWLMGEIVHGDYTTWANPEMMHSVTNYECYKGFFSSHNEENLFEIAYGFNRQFGQNGLYRHLRLYNFVDNHDVNRIASMVKRQEYLYTIYLLLYTMPGVPSIYYGSEWGVLGEKSSYSDRNLRPTLDLPTLQTRAPIPFLFQWIQQLVVIRKQQAALKNGDYQEIHIQNKQLVFMRTLANERVIVMINIDELPIQVTLQLPIQNAIWNDLLQPGEVYSMQSDHLTLDIPSFGGRILLAKN